jgi:hypothetical protein
MNATVGRRSVVSAVTIAAIARLMTYAFPATATTYKDAALAPLDDSVMQLPARACHARTHPACQVFLVYQLQHGFAVGRGGCFDMGWV